MTCFRLARPARSSAGPVRRETCEQRAYRRLCTLQPMALAAEPKRRPMNLWSDDAILSSMPPEHLAAQAASRVRPAKIEPNPCTLASPSTTEAPRIEMFRREGGVL